MRVRQPKPRDLTKERICAAALALVDEEGLEALSMRRLAARLGVEAMSLYHHVRDKADLLDALHAAVLGGIRAGFDEAAGESAGWRLVLSGMARALRSALLAHPRLAAFIASRPARGPESLAAVGLAESALVAAGFSRHDAVRMLKAIGIYTIGHVLTEVGGDPALGASPANPRHADFKFGIEALLDGFARRLP
jgi:AcrR family transcriptional regulator